jgi:predicted Fe-Mo cluster-binding NifX family protein
MRQSACKVAFAAEGTTLDSKIAPSLARADHFILVEGDPDRLEVVENPGKGLGSAAGARGARALVNERVNVVVTGNIGPKAAAILEEANIKVHAGCSGTVSEAMAKCLAGSLITTKGASYSGCLESPGTSKAVQ